MNPQEETKAQHRGGGIGGSSVPDYINIREVSELELNWFRSDLEIYDLLNPEAPYSLDRYKSLQMLIRMLSRNKRSVQIAQTLLNVIFTTKDAELLVGQP